MDPDLIEKFFLEAARHTYAGGAEKSTIPDLPGSKVLRYERGDLKYIDTYWTNGEYSRGVTLIYAESALVWSMDYDGWCKGDDERVINFLKEALLAAYTSGSFYGGRGPHTWSEYPEEQRGLTYWNNLRLDRPCSFRNFEGKEGIFEWPSRTRELFWHRYKGLLLFGDNE